MLLLCRIGKGHVARHPRAQLAHVERAHHAAIMRCNFLPRGRLSCDKERREKTRLVQSTALVMIQFASPGFKDGTSSRAILEAELTGDVPETGRPGRELPDTACGGWHYLSNATCLIQPHLFYALFVVSRITILSYIIRHC